MHHQYPGIQVGQWTKQVNDEGQFDQAQAQSYSLLVVDKQVPLKYEPSER